MENNHNFKNSNRIPLKSDIIKPIELNKDKSIHNDHLTMR